MSNSPLAVTARIASAVEAGRHAAQRGVSDNPFDGVDEALRIAFHYGWMLDQPGGQRFTPVEALIKDAQQRAAREQPAAVEADPATLNERMASALGFAAESLNEANALAVRDILRALIDAHPLLAPAGSFEPVIEVAAAICGYIASKPSPLFDSAAWQEASHKCAFQIRRLGRSVDDAARQPASGSADPEGAEARTDRILGMVEIYRNRPDAMNQRALRGFLCDEFVELLTAIESAEHEAPLFEERVYARAKQILDQYDSATAEPLAAPANYGESALAVLRAIVRANSPETRKLSDILIGGEMAPMPTPARFEEIYALVPKCIDGSFNFVGFGEALLAAFPHGVSTGVNHG
jgi:hypothetical protein